MAPIHYAAEFGDLEEVVRLVDEDPEVVNALFGGDGSTPLHWASHEGHVEVVDYLLDHGADIKAKNTSGETPLSDASNMGHVEVVEL